MRQLKIALVSPPIIGHKYRGTGIYTENLHQALKKIEDISVSLINISDSLEGFDLVHYPYFDPFFLTLPLVKKKPTIVTVHDLIPLRYPHLFPKGIKGYLKWYIQKFSLLQSRAIIADSYSSSQDIVKYTGFDINRIYTVYLGVREEFKPIKSVDILQNVKKKWKLADNFLLHVGDLNPNKNVEGLLLAFALFLKSYPKFDLVLIGRGFCTPSSRLEEMKKTIMLLGIADKIKFIDHVSTEELGVIYNLAKIYLQPSLWEGFGLPVLEAMACGCPVIVTKKSSLVEIVGDSGVYVVSDNYKEITERIKDLLSNEKKYRLMREKGIKRAKKFSWQKTAAETLEVYRKIL